jgi:hypothetical protein
MSEWISVKDRMPEEGVEVLVYGDIYLNRKGADVDFVDKSGNFFYYDEGEVTHWMPLPMPPKPKDNISREESDEQLYGGYEEDRKTMIGSNE